MKIREWALAGIAAPAILLAGGPARGQETHARTEDPRERIVLNAPARNLVLAEMRTMLSSLNGILAALAADDPSAGAQAARASGVGAAVDLAPQVREHLPERFRALGMETHRGFDALAERMAGGASEAEVQRHLATLTSSCVACHATYRIDEAR